MKSNCSWTGSKCSLHNLTPVTEQRRETHQGCDSGTSSETAALGVSTLCEMSSDTDRPVVVSSDTEAAVRSSEPVAVVSGCAVDSVSGVCGVCGAASRMYMCSCPMSAG